MQRWLRADAEPLKTFAAEIADNVWKLRNCGRAERELVRLARVMEEDFDGFAESSRALFEMPQQPGTAGSGEETERHISLDNVVYLDDPRFDEPYSRVLAARDAALGPEFAMARAYLTVDDDLRKISRYATEYGNRLATLRQMYEWLERYRPAEPDRDGQTPSD
jgi:hypothetical protein